MSCVPGKTLNSDGISCDYPINNCKDTALIYADPNINLRDTDDFTNQISFTLWFKIT